MGFISLPHWLEVQDLIYLRFSPERFKLRNISRIELDSDREILILGTLHHLHLSTSKYSLADLENLIVNWQPDRIGLESRLSDLAQGLLLMAPIDMAQAALIARRLSIPYFGFDSWKEREYELAAASEEPLDFNSTRRNNEMFQQILAGLDSARRPLILTGYSHLEPFVQRFREIGREKQLSREEKRSLFSPRGGTAQLDPELLPFLDLTIDHLERYIAQLVQNNSWSRRSCRKLKRLRKLRRQLGGPG